MFKTNQDAFPNPMLINLSQMSSNDTNDNSSNSSFASAILTGDEADPSNAITYKRVSKSILKVLFQCCSFKSLQRFNKCHDKIIVIKTSLY